MKKTLKKHIPILIYIIYIVVFIVASWIIDDECGLGLLIPFLLLYPLVIIISIYYGFKSQSKRKYFLPLFFGVVSYSLLDFFSFTLQTMIYNPDFKFSNLYSPAAIEELILNILLFAGLSFFGVILGIVFRKIKDAIKISITNK